MFDRKTLTTSTTRLIIRILLFITSCSLLYNLLLVDHDSDSASGSRGRSATGFEEFEMGIPVTPVSNGTKILLVSAMFPLSKSKHSKDEYDIWLKNFLALITTDIYMYTTPDLVDRIKLYRGNLPIIINSSYTSPFDVPTLRGREMAYTRMNKVDPEEWHHSPELYAIWNAKPFLLHSAVQRMENEGKVYNYAFWNDGGSFRSKHQYTSWPDPERVEQVWDQGSRLMGTQKIDLLFFPIFETMDTKIKDWKENMGPIANPGGQVSEGSFFGGSPSTIAWFSGVFYAYHDYFISQWLFVGIDQDIFNALFLLFPERIFTIWAKDPSIPLSYRHRECGDPWFYYQFWLSDRETRDRMRELWWVEGQSKRWRWWKEWTYCRTVQSSRSMMNILTMAFGEDWNPPTRLVETSYSLL